MKELRARTGLILAWWQRRLITSQQVIDWADAIIANASNFSLPYWILDLSLKGPSKFLGADDPDFPRAAELAFEEEFRARVECTDPEDETSIREFMLWLIRAAIWGKPKDPGVNEGYQIDHLYSDRNKKKVAMKETRKLLLKHKDDCHEIETTLRNKS